MYLEYGFSLYLRWVVLEIFLYNPGAGDCYHEPRPSQVSQPSPTEDQGQHASHNPDSQRVHGRECKLTTVEPL